MRQVNRRTVELTDSEVEIKEAFEVNLDAGLGIADAAFEALTTWLAAQRWNAALDAGFVIWLSEGYVVKTNRTWERVARRSTPLPIYAMRFGGAS